MVCSTNRCVYFNAAVINLAAHFPDELPPTPTKLLSDSSTVHTLFPTSLTYPPLCVLRTVATQLKTDNKKTLESYTQVTRTPLYSNTTQQKSSVPQLSELCILTALLLCNCIEFNIKMYQVVTSDFVKVVISTSLGSDVGIERKFLKSITVGDLKVSIMV